MKLLGDYLRRQYKIILLLVAFGGILLAVFSLYDLPAEAVAYGAALCLAVGLVVFSISFTRYLRRHRKLLRLMGNIEESAFHLPPPAGALERDYQNLLRAVTADRSRIAAESENARQDMLDYYTLWAHQIKTPIAAMHLLLQQEPGPVGEALGGELFKVEEYVEMVLSYLRLGSETTDYVLRPCELDGIVRAALRKYARLFILKKLTLDYEETHRTVVTDEKWLGFVIGQLLSNAVKYTPEGGTVRIRPDGQALVIGDSGMGIRAEDLPRVFEKGFTGYNGRENQKSSGIGLYLCRQVAHRLGVGLTITSQIGQGTAVRLRLPSPPSMAE